MFETLLIANRGEIARRIMRTARRLGLRTVAVYSDADEGAAFVREADEALWIGPALAADSYLSIDRVIEAASEAGADAVHPGYGFLSENAEFAERVAAAGLTFIGPPAAAIRAMGLKDAAKAAMAKEGVPVTPGYHGSDQSLKRLRASAKDIGYPVLIKAVAGGGGRGMRRVDAAEAFEAALASAQREARSAFGDDRVLVEKFVENPRHIEVQLIADDHGGILHLYERDCSLQRRRQKVIEEAPAPGMTEAVRSAMTDAAIRAARAVGYRNAGTVEFIVDGSGDLRPDGFWFMEMNTRIQVEHPVTELVTGLDLVEWQLRVAAGEALPDQSAIRLNGWAVEGRLCAEDPVRGFLPSSGRLDVFDLSAFTTSAGGRVTLRLDSAVEAGDRVPPDYDSMIAKAIAHAPTRDEAFDALAEGLRSAEVWPLATNAALLASLLDEPAMRAGTATTALVEERLAELTALDGRLRTTALLAGATAGLAFAGGSASPDPWSAPDGFRVGGGRRSTCVFDLEGEVGVVTLTRAAEGDEAATVDGRSVDARLGADVVETDVAVVSGWVGDQGVAATVRRVDDALVVHLEGRALKLGAPDRSAAVGGVEAGDDVKAPMPGKVLDVRAVAGVDVRAGDALVVLEAMKMEHTLSAPRDGLVVAVETAPGAQVREGEVLVRLAPIEA